MKKQFLFVMLAAALISGVLTGCGKARIAVDKARDIKFSEDGKTLVKYNSKLKNTEYAIPEGVTTIGKNAFWRCPCERSVKMQFPRYDR